MSSSLQEISKNIASSLVPADLKQDFLFVSYCSADDADVLLTVGALQKYGVNLWIDTDMHAQAGEDWLDVILPIIKNPHCKGVLYFISENSMQRVYTYAEAVLSVHIANLPCIPISLTEAPIGDLNDWCANLQKKVGGTPLSTSKKETIDKAHQMVAAEMPSMILPEPPQNLSDVIRKTKEIRFGQYAAHVIRVEHTDVVHLLQSIEKNFPHTILSSPDAPALESTVFPVKPFFGRSDILASLSAQLNQKSFALLYGEGGTGKSSLAVRFALEAAACYDTILLIPYQNSWFETLINDELVPIVNFEMARFTKAGLSKQENDKQYYIEKLKTLKLLINERTLLIIDNMNNANDDNFTEMLQLNCHVIFTTRCNFPHYQPLRLMPFNHTENGDALNLFFAYYTIRTQDKISKQEATQLDELFKAIGHLPLMIELLGKGANTADWDIDELHEKIVSCANTELPEESVPLTFPNGTAINRSISAILREIFHLIDASPQILADNHVATQADWHALQTNIMNCLSLIPVSGIRKKELGKLLNLPNFNVLQFLIDCGLVRLDPKTNIISLHQVVSDVFFSQIETPAIACASLLDGFSAQMQSANLSRYIELAFFLDFIKQRIPSSSELAYRKCFFLFASKAKEFSDLVLSKKLLEQTVQTDALDEYDQRAQLLLLSVLVEENDLTPAKDLIEKVASYPILENDSDLLSDFLTNQIWIWYYKKGTEKGTDRIYSIQRGIDLCNEMLEMPVFSNDKTKASIRYVLSVGMYRYCNAVYPKSPHRIASSNAPVKAIISTSIMQNARRRCFEKTLHITQTASDELERLYPNQPTKWMCAKNQIAECQFQLENFMETLSSHRELVEKKGELFPLHSLAMAVAYRNYCKILLTCLEQNLVEGLFDEVDRALEKMFETARYCNHAEYILMAHDLCLRRYLHTNSLDILAEKYAEATRDCAYYVAINENNANLYLNASIQKAGVALGLEEA